MIVTNRTHNKGTSLTLNRVFFETIDSRTPFNDLSEYTTVFLAANDVNALFKYSNWALNCYLAKLVIIKKFVVGYKKKF